MADAAALTVDDANDQETETKNNEPSQKSSLERQQLPSAASVAARTKLASLIELAKEAEAEGKAGYKKVADTIFDSLVGGTFDLETCFTIQDSLELVILLELLAHCTVSLKVEILGLLTATLRKSIPNLQAATRIGLVEKILYGLPHEEDELVADKLVELLSVLANYSITVKEQKTLFSTLKGENGKWPHHTVKLLKVLKLMLEKHGPDVYFNFSGQDGAAITLPPISKWPLQSGFTFSTWVCLDASHMANARTCKPYLYCFRTGKGLGYSAHFSGPMLVLECTVKAGKKDSKIHHHLVKFEFHPQKWYMVTVAYVYNRFHSSEVRCFVNGKLVSSGDTTLAHAREPLDKCYIGSSPKADATSVFSGQIAAVYLFSETLSANTVAAFYRLGPGYKGQFKFDAEIDTPLREEDRKVLYDSQLSGGIMFMYSPKACEQQLCLEASPTENPSFFCHSPHALMLEGVQAVVTHSLHSVLHSLGGIQILLPLFTQLDFSQQAPDSPDNKPDVAICAVLLSLLADLLKSSSTSQQQMMQCQGFLVISHILEKASSTHLTEEALEILLSLARHLVHSPGSGTLLGSLLDHILFNPNLWVKTPPKVQLQLFSVFATDLVAGTGGAAHLRREVGVNRLMHMLKTYYWMSEPRDLTDSEISDKPRPTKEEVFSLRAFLLLLVKQLVVKEKGITEDEFRSILSYLVTTMEEDNLLDVLQLVLSVMTEQPVSTVPVFDKVEGIRVLFKLLDSTAETVRVYSLKVIGCFLQFCLPRRRQELLQNYGLFALIGEKLVKHAVTRTTYNVLFEILVGRVSKQIVSGKHPEPDSTFIFHNAPLAPIMVNMLHKTTPGRVGSVSLSRQGSVGAGDSSVADEDDVDLKRVFLSDLVLLLNHSKQNRSLVLQLSCWQDWLFSLARIHPKNKDEQRNTDTVFSLFRMLLHHAFQEEREGWRIWMDTLSILHGQISLRSKEEKEAAETKRENKRGSPKVDKKETQNSPQRESPISPRKAPDSPGKSPDSVRKSPDSPGKASQYVTDDPRKRFFQALLEGKGSAAASDSSPDAGSGAEVEGEAQTKDESNVFVVDSSSTENQDDAGTDQAVELREGANSPGAEPEGHDSGESRSTTCIGSDVRGADAAGEAEAAAEDVAVATKDGVQTTSDVQLESERAAEVQCDEVAAAPENEEVHEVEERSEKTTTNTEEGVSRDDSLGSGPLDEETASEDIPSEVETTGGSETCETKDEQSQEGNRDSSKLLAPDSVAKDVDSSLSIAVQNSFIGAPPGEADTMIPVGGSGEKSASESAEAKSDIPAVSSDQDAALGSHSSTAVGGKSSPDYAASPSGGKSSPDRASSPSGGKSSPSDVASSSGGKLPTHSDSFTEETRARDSPTAAGAGKPEPEGAGNYKAHVNIPEFLWSPIHQRLLGDLLFAIESDVQVWKSHNRKTVMDYVNSKDNATYLWNLAHFVSVLADNIIFCCGDLLPLLSSVTSRDYGQDVIEPCGGMNLETSFSFLNRLMSLVDVIVFTSTLTFSGVESDMSLANGGFLRQCLRLVFCCSARNRLVCRQRNRPAIPLVNSGKLTKKSLRETREAIKALIASTEPPTDKDLLQNIPGHVTTVTDPEKLLQEMDVNRLRAVVYRDFEDSRQAQFLALSVVYFVAVTMVAKYRDLLRADDAGSRTRNNTSPDSDGKSGGKSDEGLGGSEDVRSRAASWGGQRNATDDEVFPFHDDVMSRQRGAAELSRMSLTEKVELGFKSSGALLREVLVDFSPFLSRVLLGSHGQELVLEGLSCQKTDSTIELVMLLCSQEWQNSLQRHGGMAFTEMVNEGRLLSHSMRERVVLTTSEAYVIMNKLTDISNQKHAQFTQLCSLTEGSYHENVKLYDQMLLATKRRDYCVAKALIQKVLNIMCSEHGAWSSLQSPADVQFYRLDLWEDDSRRRMRFVRNPHGSSHPEATLLGSLEGKDQRAVADTQPLNFAKLTSSQAEDSYSLSEEDVTEASAEERGLGRDLSDHVVFSTSCHLIAPCVVAPGSLTITSSAMFFTVDEDEPECKNLDPKVLVYMSGLHVKWPLHDIRAVFSRRYLLQNCAVEVFTADGTSVFFKLGDQDAVKRVVRALPPVGVGTYYGIPQTRSASLFSPRQLFQKSSVTQRWQRGEVSNFHYLMFLNTIAGRTYCDLNQYPVFPWVLTKFESEHLDLRDQSIYRDLSKPIGALNPQRHAQFMERYASWDENDDIPPFHYGTHYSTSGFTLAWLIRLEPFATQFLDLQGGKFDHPGRTFCSVLRSWNNCQRDTSDVKELIPELFYLPEMFANSNRFTFGVDEEHGVIDDVELPRWAATPEEFVMLHRAALESEYVSAHLHEWIDLIFGFKQRGPEAVQATNVFFHLTYEGNVDLDSIVDPVMREAVEQQIKSFGQTPSQLLTEAHPPRGLNIQLPGNQEEFKSIYLTFVVTANVPVTYVAAHTESTVPVPAVVTISCNQCFSVNRWLASEDKSQSLHGVQIEEDPLLSTTSGRLRRQLGEPLDQTVTPSASCFIVTDDNRHIMACGYWDNSFKCFSVEAGKLTQSVFGHWDVVTCLAYSHHVGLTGGDALIASGSRDATVLVWQWSTRLQRVVCADSSPGGNPSPVAILTGHEQTVICVEVSASLGLVVSGSQEGPCLIHTTSGDLLRTLRAPKDCVRPRLIKLTLNGWILINYADGTGHVAVFTINGKLLAAKQLDDQIIAIALTGDGNFFVSGGFSRYLRVWRTHDLALVHTYPPCDGSIRALDISNDQRCLVAGLASGSILAIAVNFSLWSLT